MESSKSEPKVEEKEGISNAPRSHTPKDKAGSSLIVKLLLLDILRVMEILFHRKYVQTGKTSPASSFQRFQGP